MCYQILIWTLLIITSIFIHISIALRNKLEVSIHRIGFSEGLCAVPSSVWLSALFVFTYLCAFVHSNYFSLRGHLSKTYFNDFIYPSIALNSLYPDTVTFEVLQWGWDFKMNFREWTSKPIKLHKLFDENQYVYKIMGSNLGQSEIWSFVIGPSNTRITCKVLFEQGTLNVMGLRHKICPKMLTIQISEEACF